MSESATAIGNKTHASSTAVYRTWPAMSVIQPQFVSVCRQLVQRSRLLFTHLTSVRDEIFECDSTMRSDHTMLKPAGLDFLDHEWARHVKEVGGFDRREFAVRWHEGDLPPLAHGSEQLPNEFQ